MRWQRATHKGGAAVRASQDFFGNNLSPSFAAEGGQLAVSIDAPLAKKASTTGTPVYEIAAGFSCNLVANVTNNLGPLTYQWYKNSDLIVGATAATYTANTATLDTDGSIYNCKVEDSTGLTGDGRARLKVLAVVILSYQIVGAYVELANVPLSVTAQGNLLTYQWYDSGGLIPGATSSVYHINPAQLADTGIYKVVVTSSYGAVTIDNQYVQIIPGGSIVNPTITITLDGSPTSSTLPTGATLRFSSSGLGTGPLTYQWQVDRTSSPGVWVNLATTPNLTITGAVTNDSGSYRCLISSPVDSDVASNSIPVVIAAAPFITGVTANFTGWKGLPYTLTVTAVGVSPFTYQWEKFNGVSWDAVVGATAASYDLSPLTAVNAGSYRVVVANGVLPNATSATCVVTAGNIQVTASSPTTPTGIAGNSVTMSVNVNGSIPITYVWEKFNGVSWDVIPGQTASLYSITGLQFSDAGSYRCTATNPYGSGQVGFTLTISGGGVVITQPGTNAIYGQARTLTAVVSALAPYTYQWYKNNVVIPGETAASYTIASVIPADSGAVYKVVVNNVFGSFNNTATVTGVVASFADPTAVAAPSGSSTTLSIGYVQGGTPTFQWFKGASTIPGATSPTYTVNPVLDADVGSYSLKITNEFGGPVQSAGISLTVTNITIVVQPYNAAAAIGSSPGFLCQATGPGTLTYQWYKNAILMPGETSQALLILDFDIADAASYYCVVSNIYGSTQSLTATLIVLATHTSLDNYTQPAINVGAFNVNVAFPTLSIIGDIIYLDNDGGAGFYQITNIVGSLYTLQRKTAVSGGEFLPTIATGVLVHGSSVTTLADLDIEVLVTDPAEIELGDLDIEVLVTDPAEIELGDLDIEILVT